MAAFAAGIALLAGCYDPFGPVTPETPTAGSTGKGSKSYTDVPRDFGNALALGQSDRISAFLVDTVKMTDGNGNTTLPTSQFDNCLDSILSTRLSSFPLQWELGATIQWVLINPDVEVGTLSYTLMRSSQVLATATATWTVVRIGTEWKLQQWAEGATNSSWVKLCQSPR